MRAALSRDCGGSCCPLASHGACRNSKWIFGPLVFNYCLSFWLRSGITHGLAQNFYVFVVWREPQCHTGGMFHHVPFNYGLIFTWEVWNIWFSCTLCCSTFDQRGEKCNPAKKYYFCYSFIWSFLTSNLTSKSSTQLYLNAAAEGRRSLLLWVIK